MPGYARTSWQRNSELSEGVEEMGKTHNAGPVHMGKVC